MHISNSNGLHMRACRPNSYYHKMYGEYAWHLTQTWYATHALEARFTEHAERERTKVVVKQDLRGPQMAEDLCFLGDRDQG